MAKTQLHVDDINRLKKEYGGNNVTSYGVKGFYILKEIRKNNENWKKVTPEHRSDVDFRGLSEEEEREIKVHCQKKYQSMKGKENSKDKDYQNTRDTIKTMFNTNNLMNLPPEKLARSNRTGVLDKILKGENFFVG